MENKFNYVDQNLGRNIIKIFIFPDVLNSWGSLYIEM